jgi:superfamily II DNA/RNA helicase
MEFSPDKNPDDDGKAAENLRQLVEAFQVLSGGYKKGKYEKEYQMLQRLQRRREQEMTTKAQTQIPLNETSFQKLSDILPSHLYDKVCLRTNSTRPTLLPVQESSYQAILSGENVILNAPSGSGKTLGYILPLLARLPDEKEVDVPEEPIEVANKRGRRRRRNRRSRSFSELKEMNQSCKPSIVVLTPSQNVTMEVGKQLSQYHRDSEKVATVFGGVPIKRQKHLLQNSDLEIVVGMPGRILEYIKEGVLDLSGLQTFVLDEADDMLNSKEKHAIAAILRKVEGDYQMVLASATMPKSVLDFCRETMEMDNSSDNLVTLTSTEYAVDNTVEPPKLIVDEPTAMVNHWHTATRSSDRAMLSLDIVATLEPRPRVGVVFVDSKAEVETVARVLALSPDVRVSAIYEGMPGEERAQAIHTLGDIDDSDVVCSLIVTTDLAARDMDLPGADLILQFGVPRQSTNGDFYDAELYTNRIKCAGRSDSDGRDTEAILLYDYEDEGRLLPGLQTEMEVDNGIVMRPRALPSPQHILEASYYEHAKQLCSNFPYSASVVDCFEKQLKSEVLTLDATEREAELLRRLAVAMAALSDQSRVNGDSD